MNICPNAYYNYRKNRKKNYQKEQEKILKEIKNIYHELNGVPGHRTVMSLLKNRGISKSKTTVHKYMNCILKLKSIVRRKKPCYVKGKAHKIFDNKLDRKFNEVKEKNHIWCTDFTYLFLSNGSKRYNCTIIDLYDRSVIASLNGKSITSQLAIETIKQALSKHKPSKNGLILHSDQGSQFTSKEFTEFCEHMKIEQSMSKAGCPYDNAPMERFYNTLKNELTDLHVYKTDEQLNKSVYDFSFVWYNHGRPHSYNNGLTPYQARNMK